MIWSACSASVQWLGTLVRPQCNSLERLFGLGAMTWSACGRRSIGVVDPLWDPINRCVVWSSMFCWTVGPIHCCVGPFGVAQAPYIVVLDPLVLHKPHTLLCWTPWWCTSPIHCCVGPLGVVQALVHFHNSSSFFNTTSEQTMPLNDYAVPNFPAVFKRLTEIRVSGS
jgi:hypothetical protein